MWVTVCGFRFGQRTRRYIHALRLSHRRRLPQSPQSHLQDGNGKTVWSGRVRNDRQSVGSFLAPIRTTPTPLWRRVAIGRCGGDDQDAQQGQRQRQATEDIPGIGEFFARLIDAEIDDIGRFGSAKKLAAYAGIVPSTYASGGKTYHGRMIKQGNKWLRWAFIEAVAPTVAGDPQLKELYQRLSTKGSNRAKVVVSRRLLTIAFQVLRDGRCYEQRGACPEAGQNNPGCPDLILASLATPGCALQENGKPGAERRYVTGSRPARATQGHGLENGSRAGDQAPGPNGSIRPRGRSPGPRSKRTQGNPHFLKWIPPCLLSLEEEMELLHRRCCGVDVHKETVVAGLRLVADGKVTTEVRTFQMITSDLSALVGVVGGKRVHACGHGGERRLLEASLAYLG